MKRVIFHIDVNAAFLSWEAVYRLYHLGGKVDLRKIASAVGGDTALRHGIILAKSIPAKRYRIQTGEAIWEARRKCPGLVLVPPNYGLYERCSQALMEILRQYTPDVEPYSIDEAFLDMTEIGGLWGEPLQAAHRIRRRIREELGFTVNIGVAGNKLLAKMASDFAKPDQVHTLWPQELEKKMWPLPVSDLFFVGRRTSRKLENMGIHTIGELALADPSILRSHLGKHGELIWNFANGRDVSLVEPEPPWQKGYGNSTTIPFDVTEASAARLVLLALSETVGMRLRRAQVRAETLSVGIKTFDFAYASHQMTLANATDITGEIHRYACRLFDELWDGRPIRHLSLHAGRITDQGRIRQQDLFDRTDYGKLEQLDAAIDQIRGRYGNDSVMRAAFIHIPVDHMLGGISREKRTADYSRIKVE